MPFPGTGPIWFNGEFKTWEDVNLHVMSHVVHYGSSVFEGIRCYPTDNGPAILRLDAHIDRLVKSAKIYRMETKFSADELAQACIDTIKENGMDDCYIRPVIYRGFGAIGVDPSSSPVDVAIGVWEWGKYLGQDALEKGVNVRVSSWNRPAANTSPSLAKAGGGYLNNQLVKLEAIADGYDEGIVLDVGGYVAEGSGENIFIVVDGGVVTPPSSSSLLPGITRNSVITLSRELGHTVRKQLIPREALYIADEVFFTGTAAEITPIASVDRRNVGEGSRGPVTKHLQDAFFGIITGKVDDRHGWLTRV